MREGYGSCLVCVCVRLLPRQQLHTGYLVYMSRVRQHSFLQAFKNMYYVDYAENVSLGDTVQRETLASIKFGKPVIRMYWRILNLAIASAST